MLARQSFSLSLLSLNLRPSPRPPPSSHPTPATPSPLTLSESLILTIVRATPTSTNPEERRRRLLTIGASSYRPREDISMRNVDGLGHSRAYSKEDSWRRSKDLTGLHDRVIYNFHRHPSLQTYLLEQCPLCSRELQFIGARGE